MLTAQNIAQRWSELDRELDELTDQCGRLVRWLAERERFAVQAVGRLLDGAARQIDQPIKLAAAQSVRLSPPAPDGPPAHASERLDTS